MSDTRSQRLAFLDTTAAGYFNLFTVPDPHVILVKSVYVSNHNALAADVQVNIASGSFVTIVGETLQPNTFSEWQGWVAMNPGDNLFVHAGQADVAFWVSGAVLLGPVQYPVLPSDLALARPLPASPPARRARP